MENKKKRLLTISDLRQRQSLPLEAKIRKAAITIEKFYEMNDGDVYISKGGVDSNIVEWITKNYTSYGDRIKGVCVASVEPVENIKHNYELGNILLKSKVTKKEVIQDWGYPLISKEVSMAISRYHRTKLERVKKYRMYGDRGDGKKYSAGVIPKMYRQLVYAPFEISERCCQKTKKDPLKQFGKKNKEHNKLHPITGEMAVESKKRRDEYLEHGCIMLNKKEIKCTPLGAWLAEDIMECIDKYNIKIPEIYGRPIKVNGKYKFSGEQRTGCEICGFGIMADTERFNRLKERKPNLYNEMMRGGKWIRKDIYRWVKFRPGSMPIWSNLYFMPDERGYGYKFVLNYFYEALRLTKENKNK